MDIIFNVFLDLCDILSTNHSVVRFLFISCDSKVPLFIVAHKKVKKRLCCVNSFQYYVTVKRFQKFRLNFSILLFVIRVNLLHPKPSLFTYGLLLSLWWSSIFVKYYFQVPFNFKVILSMVKNNSNYRDVAPLFRWTGMQAHVNFYFIIMSKKRNLGLDLLITKIIIVSLFTYL